MGALTPLPAISLGGRTPPRTHVEKTPGSSQFQGTEALGGQKEPSPWPQMSPPAVPGGVAGTFLTFWAVPANCAMGTRAADASLLPSHSLGCLTSSCAHSSYRPEADGQGGGEGVAAFRQGEWLSEPSLMASASLGNVLAPAQGESSHPSRLPSHL